MDARNSHASEERDNELDPYWQLAEIFNDRARDFQPYNRAMAYSDGVSLFKNSKEVSPEVYNALKDVDPNEPRRPTWEGEWVNKKYKELVRQITIP